jgi:hypothetical protein
VSFPSQDQLRIRVIGTTLRLSTSAEQEDRRCRVAAGLGMKVDLLVAGRSHRVLPEAWEVHLGEAHSRPVRQEEVGTAAAGRNPVAADRRNHLAAGRNLVAVG